MFTVWGRGSLIEWGSHVETVLEGGGYVSPSTLALQATISTVSKQSAACWVDKRAFTLKP